MEIEPVESHDQPAYPTRRDMLLGTASFLLVSLTGCSAGSPEAQDGQTIVAPIFEHGEGRGAEGCLVITPPVFLSEEEAMQILREELAQHGIRLKAGHVLKGVSLPGRCWQEELTEGKDGEKDVKFTVVEIADRKPLKLDGVDPDKHVAVKFVSRREYCDLGGPKDGSTVTSYDFKDVARYVVDHAKKHGRNPVVLAVFYDPLGEMSERGDWGEGWREDWKEEEKRRKAESKVKLRQQAQDFAAWLKKEKAIK